MFCKNCGGQIPSNANFCSHCGTKVEFTDEFIHESDPQEEYKREEQRIDDSYFHQNKNRDYVETGRASIGWYYLGFFCPIAGWILGSIYAYSKPDLAYKCRRGAWFGFIFDLVCLLFELLLQII